MNLPDYVLQALLIVAVCSVPVYVLLGRLVFGSVGRFGECVFYWFKPDSWSWIEGELEHDWTAELQLLLWVILCVIAVAVETFIMLPLLA